jgi:hypothetical protein
MRKWACAAEERKSLLGLGLDIPAQSVPNIEEVLLQLPLPLQIIYVFLTLAPLMLLSLRPLY